MSAESFQFPKTQGENSDLPIRSERKKSIDDCDFFNTISEMRTLQASSGQNIESANGNPANREYALCETEPEAISVRIDGGSGEYSRDTYNKSDTPSYDE